MRALPLEVLDHLVSHGFAITWSQSQTRGENTGVEMNSFNLPIQQSQWHRLTKHRCGILCRRKVEALWALFWPLKSESQRVKDR